MISFSKKALKYYNCVDAKTRKKFDKSFTQIELGAGEKVKDINRHRDLSDTYRLKLEHYRIMFNRTNSDIHITDIGVKNDMKFRRTGFH